MSDAAPADRGLSSLGLLMQLAGHTCAAISLVAVAGWLFAPVDEDGRFLLVAVFGVGLVRSVLHRAAGAGLVYGARAPAGPDHASPDERRFAGVHHYVLASVAHTIVIAVVMSTSTFDMPLRAVAFVAAGSLLWPTVLAIAIHRPALRALATHVPAVEDRGFEAMAILMVVLGSLGLLAALTLLGTVFELPGDELQQGGTIIVILVLATYAVRSGLHLHAGISGLRETSLERAVERSTRYASFAVISAFCLGSVFLLFAIALGGSPVAFAWVAAVVWMMVAWPTAIRRFVTDRQFDHLLAGDLASHRRAPDAGLSGLGWLLLGTATMNASVLLVDCAHLGAGFEFAPGGWSHPCGFQIAQIALGSAAGLGLLEASSRGRMLAAGCALVGGAISLYLAWPVVQALGGADRYARPAVMAYAAWLAFQLVLPLATLLLVTRRIAPAARARYRARS